MKKDIAEWQKYENLVGSVQQAILNSEVYFLQKNIIVEVNKKIIDNNGIERQFDIYWEYELGGVEYKTVIECKDYSSKISIKKIDALIGKVRDIPDINKALFATKTGYQSGAIDKAKKNNIDLLIVREQNDSDWVGKDGSPLLKYMNIHVTAIHRAEILSIIPTFDKKWLDNHPEIDLANIRNNIYLNTNTFINDIKISKRYSIKEFEKNIVLDGEYNTEYTKYIEFEDAFFEINTFKIKIKALNYTFLVRKPSETFLEIDGSKELKAVVEYLNSESKKIIYNNGYIKTV